jgi:hypothetical protein
MERYRSDIGHKYDIINNPEILKTEIAPSALEGREPDLLRDGAWYLKWIKEQFGQKYLDEIQSYVDDERLTSLPFDTRALVIMPVSALSDEVNIYNTLEMYNAQQGNAIENIPILLWINALEDNLFDSQNIESCDATVHAIYQAKKDFTRLNIVDMYHILPSEEVIETLDTGGPWGLLMRKAYDIASMTAYSIAQQSPTKSEVAIIRNDSDVVHLDPDYFETYMESISRNTGPGIQGLSRFGATNDKEPNYPGLSLVMNFLNKLDLYTGDRYRFQAANFAISASAYCQMGGMGYPYFTGIGSCDALLGERLKVVANMSNGAMQDASSIIQPINAKLVTDWSRPLAAYLSEGDPQRAWTTWSDSVSGLKQRHDDLSTNNSYVQSGREDIDISIQRVEQHITRLTKGLDDNIAATLLRDFFKDSSLYSLNQDYTFTREGVDYFRRYYLSELPYWKYASKLKGEY